MICTEVETTSQILLLPMLEYVRAEDILCRSEPGQRSVHNKYEESMRSAKEGREGAARRKKVVEVAQDRFAVRSPILVLFCLTWSSIATKQAVRCQISDRRMTMSQD
jgi:hypothetical protein